MKKLFSIFVCVFEVAQLFSYSKPPVNPPANVHPRLMFSAENLPEIKENLKISENAGAVLEMERILKKYCTDSSSGFFPQKNRKSIYNGDVLAAVEAAAFKYALEKNPEFAEKAFSGFLKCCETMNLTGIYDDYRPYGQMMLTAAEIYDWCFDALEKKQKKILISKVMDFASNLQIGYPPEKQGAITGHGCENQLLRALLASGIAFYDEKKEIWEVSAGRFYDEFVPVRKFFYDSCEPNFQGCDYGPYRSIFDLWASLLITSMGGPEPFDGKIKNWDEFYIYTKRPDGLSWRKGDNHSIERNYDDTMRIATNAFLCFAVTKNPHSKFYAKKLTKDFSYFKYNNSGESDELLTPVQFLIFNNTKIQPEDYSEEKSVYYAPSPCGEYYAFSEWNNPKAAGVHAKIGEYFSANHEHADAGSFEIFCNGILANVSGYYQSGGGSNGYKSEMTQKYFHSSISQNTLLIEPKNPALEDYGSQIQLGEKKNLQEWLENKSYHRGKILCYDEKIENSRKTVFISGEIANAYTGAKSVIRSMLSVFTGDEEKPLFFVVYDQLKLQKGRSGVFLFHSNTEPDMKNDGKSFVIRNGGVLHNSILLPEDSDVKKIGGSGSQWEICGKNFGDESNSRLKTGNEAGWGRVEIRSKSRLDEEVFLNLMQVSPEKECFDEVLLERSDEFEKISVGNVQIKIFKNAEKAAEVTELAVTLAE